MSSTPATSPDNVFPAVKHRPRPAVAPAVTRSLAPARKALLGNSDVNLCEHGAGAVTGGLVDPHRFSMLVQAYQAANGNASLLVEKRVSEGVVFVTQQHDRFLDLGILPDIAGARWLHQVKSRLQLDAGRPVATLGTSTENGRPWAVIELTVTDHAEFADRIREAFRRTAPDGQAVKNDYTNSILQSGVKEPLTLVVMRVVFADGSEPEYYLVAIDGNSRLVSTWKARVGGDAEQAATACIEAVVGTASGKTFRHVTQRAARDAISAQVNLINRGLQDEQLTETTIRLGQTLTVPSVVVVGGWADGATGNPLTDLPAAREDLIASIHTEAAPWDEEAKAEQTMTRMLRRAVLETGAIDADTRQAIEGRLTVDEMHARLGLPPNRLWATALTLQAILNGWDKGVSTLFAEEFANRRPTRMVIGKQLSTTALAAYKTDPQYAVAKNAFADGGPITDRVWKSPWTLTTGDSAQKVLDDILDRALAGESSAIAELSVLGGTAAMLQALLTRDRGSKLTESGERVDRKVPYRTRPDKVIAKLTESAGGLRMLHSLATAFVGTGNPKMFHTEDDPAGTFTAGDPVTDNAGAQVNIDYEWDLFAAADPAGTREALAEIAAHVPVDQQEKEPPAVTARNLLRDSAKNAVAAVDTLVVLSASQGRDVFGDPVKIEEIKSKLQKARDKLNQNAPEPSTDPFQEEYDDEDGDG
ncbi:hypothetical protein FB565_002998 [Actinoplanes lutulentus]|uniref:Uncharacterized protein n=1 Tax=Actinoplanes lutulentus TaxID=1287878 RepID=A0A327Z1N4_9ACTN|nr:hypothetical protein [Actinoplanes lutulentus]MBB2943285.1 hypothetical protein [Actinoplanes lutulentus]RAK28345.1 hypothetical protein B0I29_120113 [Actinoplanes lutulentus]